METVSIIGSRRSLNIFEDVHRHAKNFPEALAEAAAALQAFDEAIAELDTL